MGDLIRRFFRPVRWLLDELAPVEYEDMGVVTALLHRQEDSDRVSNRVRRVDG